MPEIETKESPPDLAGRTSLAGDVGHPDGVKFEWDTVVSAIPNWFYAVARPIRKSQELLEINADQAKLHEAIQLWILSFLITAGIQMLLFKSLGQTFEDKGFWIISTTVQTISMIAVGLAVQVGLRIRGIKCELSDLVVLFICYFFIYEPVIAALSYSSDQTFFAAMASSKSHGIGFNQTLRTLIWGPQNAIDQFAIGWIFSLFLFLVLFSIGSTMIGLEVADRYDIDRTKCLSAVAFAVSIFVPPLYIAFEYFNLYTIYTYWHT